MTKREAAIISAYTGILLGDFGDMHEFIEEAMGRQVFVHEMGTDAVFAEIKEASKPFFLAIEVV